MTADPKNINIEDYNYNLPKERIAQFPLKKRDNSKLLLVKNGVISQDMFYNIVDHIPEKSLLIFNNTKVIQARMLFQKPTGAMIEIFCLEPYDPVKEIQESFAQTSSVTWKCFVGNARRWKTGQLVRRVKSDEGEISVTAEKIGSEANVFLVEFSWEPTRLNFSRILELIGLVPLPPYINRKAIDLDKTTYQTVYAQNSGSVAAPTAGLHFTPEVLSSLKKKNVVKENITLHVGAGTFTPVVTSQIKDHKMHMEHVLIDRDTIERLAYHDKGKIIAVGTTTVRTVESLYWFGVKLIINKDKNRDFIISQWEPYELQAKTNISRTGSLNAVLEYMDKNDLSVLRGITQLIIAPGYDFKIIEALITNFHQPGSTLLLLVAAITGDTWKDSYEYALNNDFRFLSYGDSCLFIP